MRRFPIDGGLLLLDRRSNSLFAFNDAARQVWDLIEAGRSPDALVAAFAASWGIPQALARTDTDAIIAEWRSQGVLIERNSDSRADTWRAARAKPPPALPDIWRAPPAAGWWAQWICTIRGIPIAFAIETELPGTFRLLFAHLATPDAAPQVHLWLRTGPIGERVLIENGRLRLSTIDPAEAIGTMFVAALEHTRPGIEWLTLIHGAAVGRGRQSLVLAGPSGSGKSTLAAGLIRCGYDFLSDDLVAVTKPDGARAPAIAPWPLPLSIKQGSLAILDAQHPQLAHAPAYQTKGMEARILLPFASAWEAEPVPLRHILFPRFSAGAQARAERLSAFETIERLLSDRVWLGSPITVPHLSMFLAWLKRTPAHVLSYGSLDDGMRLVEDILAEDFVA